MIEYANTNADADADILQTRREIPYETCTPSNGGAVQRNGDDFNFSCMLFPGRWEACRGRVSFIALADLEATNSR